MPGRKLGLITMRHRRWELIDHKDLAEDFDKIVFFPLVVHSFKPRQLYKLLKTIILVKKFNLASNDILVGVGPSSYHVNCFISYYPKNFSVGVVRKKNFDLTHNFELPVGPADYQIKPTAYFFNKIIEPLLGLYKTVQRVEWPGGRGAFAISRFQKAINRVFDVTYVVRPLA